MMHSNVYFPYRGRTCLILIVLCISTAWSSSLTDAIRFRRYAVDQGLSQSQVSCIMQDQEGFLWLGTQDGLNRFDGYSFKIYRHDARDSLSISDNYVNCLFLDSDGDLWIGTYSGGLNRYDRDRDGFEHFMHDSSARTSISGNNVWSITEGPNRNLWIGVWGGGLNAFDRTHGTWTIFRHNPKDSASLSDNRVLCQSWDHDGRLWVGSFAGLDWFDPIRGSFVHMQTSATGSATISPGMVTTIFEDRKNNVWVGTLDHGLTKILPDRVHMQKFSRSGPGMRGLTSDRISAVRQDSSGALWIATRDGGVSLLDDSSGQVRRVVHDPRDPTSLSVDAAISLYRDSQGGMWIGTDGGGVNHYDQHRFKFRSVSIGNGQSQQSRKPYSTFTVEFFATSPAYVSAGRDGQTYLGDVFLTTDTAGNVSFDATIGTAVSAGQSITATATDNDGNTSEFSAPIVATLIPPPGTEVVTNSSDSGPGSLRQAILNVNAKNAGDTIAFNIPGTGAQTIQPTSPLPEITSRVVLDGYTQPGSSVNTSAFGDGNNAVLKIVLDGNLAGNAASALRVKGGGSVVRGLVINNFKTTTGIEISGSGGCRVEGCFVGTDITGSQAVENMNGVLIAGSSYNTIGGTTAAQRNVISGSKYAGVYVVNGASQNSIMGNYIGLSASGKEALGNTEIGVYILDASTNKIGGATVGAGNAIGGCVSESSVGVAIWINGAAAPQNVVMGNLVGLNADGSDTVHNNAAGMYVDGSANIVGGTASGARNIISGHHFGGLFVDGDTNVVLGNYIGTDITGIKALGNRGSGLQVTGSGNTIGGCTVGAGNVVSGNSGCGISLSGTIGSITPHEARFNRIEGNRVGTQSDGASPLGNTGVGILFGSSAFENAIGDTLEGAGNIIAFNDSGGVLIPTADPKSSGATSTNNRILHNSVFGNGCLGIDLCGGVENDVGVTANDPGDSDDGPNNLQNAPELSAVQGGSSFAVHGSLNSTPNSAFLLEFFATPVTGNATPGEGQTYLGWTRVFTDASGNAPISTTIAVPVAVGRAITATATDSLGNTSEFSPAIVVSTTELGSASDVPRETALMQNFPNPFNPTTMIRYALMQRSEVSLAVFNVLGQEIVTLVDGTVGPGYHEVQFDGRSLASGVYLYRLKAGNYTRTMTFVLLE